MKWWNVGNWENISTYCLLVRSFVRLCVVVSPLCRLCNLLTENIPLAHTGFVFMCVWPKCSAVFHVVVLVFSWISIRTRSFARTLPHIHSAHLAAAHLNFVWNFYFQCFCSRLNLLLCGYRVGPHMADWKEKNFQFDFFYDLLEEALVDSDCRRLNRILFCSRCSWCGRLVRTEAARMPLPIRRQLHNQNKNTRNTTHAA